MDARASPHGVDFGVAGFPPCRESLYESRRSMLVHLKAFEPMADKEFTIKIKTQGDPSGAKNVSQAIDGTGEASRKAADEAARNYKRIGEAAAGAAATARAAAGAVTVADTPSGRSWA